MSRSTNEMRELGSFVRAIRERLKPAEVGLAVGERRRTPGLRREEAAQLSGLSVTWYTWLEQGREMSLSPSALARLAVALKLLPAERRYLFRLAGKADPHPEEAGPEQLQPAVHECVNAIDAPAYVLDGTWTARCWNEKAEALFAGWLDGNADRNLLNYIFLNPAAPDLICDYLNRARRVVAEFRAEAAAGEGAFRSLVEDLAARSPLFKQLWSERSVLGREGGERTFRSRGGELLRFEQVSFALSGSAEFKLTVLLPR